MIRTAIFLAKECYQFVYVAWKVPRAVCTHAAHARDHLSREGFRGTKTVVLVPFYSKNSWHRLIMHTVHLVMFSCNIITTRSRRICLTNLSNISHLSQSSYVKRIPMISYHYCFHIPPSEVDLTISLVLVSEYLVSANWKSHKTQQIDNNNHEWIWKHVLTSLFVFYRNVFDIIGPLLTVNVELQGHFLWKKIAMKTA